MPTDLVGSIPTHGARRYMYTAYWISAFGITASVTFLFKR